MSFERKNINKEITGIFDEVDFKIGGEKKARS
jgi:hypothetical protein